jgi:hypothetical protein
MKQILRNHKSVVLFLLFLGMTLLPPVEGSPEQTDRLGSGPEGERMALAQAVMCEDLKELSPVNAGVVFPVTIGAVSCFSIFDPVPRKTIIYHNWYRRDKLVTKIKLSVQPPRWSTFSRMQLREADKGPWRLEITDEDGSVLRLLRFSIID